MTQKTAFIVDIKIEGFFNKQNDGRRIYVKGKTLKWVIDSNRFSLCELIHNLSEEICWGSCQTPKIWMFDRNEGKDVGVVSESQISEIFRMYQNERIFLFIIVICDLDGSSKCTSSLEQPEQFDVEMEEVLYGSDVEMDFSNEIVNHDIENVIVSEEDNVLEEPIIDDVEGNVHEEPRIDDIVQCEANLVFDPENPKIKVNALFSDVDTFRKALRHFAIKRYYCIIYNLLLILH
jgi:hypothetical protein